MIMAPNLGGLVLFKLVLVWSGFVCFVLVWSVLAYCGSIFSAMF